MSSHFLASLYFVITFPSPNPKLIFCLSPCLCSVSCAYDRAEHRFQVTHRNSRVFSFLPFPHFTCSSFSVFNRITFCIYKSIFIPTRTSSFSAVIKSNNTITISAILNWPLGWPNQHQNGNPWERWKRAGGWGEFERVEWAQYKIFLRSFWKITKKKVELQNRMSQYDEFYNEPMNWWMNACRWFRPFVTTMQSGSSFRRTRSLAGSTIIWAKSARASMHW